MRRVIPVIEPVRSVTIIRVDYHIIVQHCMHTTITSANVRMDGRNGRTRTYLLEPSDIADHLRGRANDEASIPHQLSLQQQHND